MMWIFGHAMVHSLVMQGVKSHSGQLFSGQLFHYLLSNSILKHDMLSLMNRTNPHSTKLFVQND